MSLMTFETLVVGVLSPILVLLVTFVIDMAKQRRAQQAAMTDIKSALTKLEENVKTLESMVAKQEEIANKHNLEEVEARVSLIRDRIVQAHTWFMNKGAIDAYSLQALEKMYEIYAKTEENSFVKRLVADISGLKISEE